MKRAAIFSRIGLFLLASLLALNISAQNPGGPPGPGGPGGPGRGFGMTEDDIKERVASTAQALKLTDEQQKKVLAVEMDWSNKMQIEFQKMRNSGGPPAEGDREAMREKMMKMRDERNAQYEAILTPEQYKQFTAMQEQRMREMREQRQQQPPPGQEGEQTDRPARGRGRN